MATKKKNEEIVSLQGITNKKDMEKEISKLSATDLIGLLANNSGTDSGDLLSSIAGSLISTDTSSSSTTTGKTTSMKVTAEEKKLVQAYRKASESKQKEALELLSGKAGDSSGGGLLNGLLGNLLSGLFKK
ncbi:MAG: hypothetical protein IJL16_06460 [Clostridia bacterium]|nr:hypothetical protein [Clostridia bacterium]